MKRSSVQNVGLYPYEYIVHRFTIYRVQCPSGLEIESYLLYLSIAYALSLHSRIQLCPFYDGDVIILLDLVVRYINIGCCL